jgi:hypothetical protein
MAETLLQYRKRVRGQDGSEYEARACGCPMRGGIWQGWIEFLPVAGGAPLRTGRETTQPNRDSTAYWATGVSAVYLEGALRRALSKPTQMPTLPKQPAIFPEPAPSPVLPVRVRTWAVLDPFAVYKGGELVLRRELSALAAWHLVNIAVTYKLSTLEPAALNRLPAATLLEMIVTGVRQRGKPARGSPP